MQGTSTTQAVRVLKEGGVVVYPTETAYGLGADATDARAVAVIFKLKGRVRTKSVLLLMQNEKKVRQYAHVGALERALMKKYWPGALTIVLRVKKKMRKQFAQGVVAGNGTIAVRISSHPVARRLVHALGKPLVSTSANRAGGPNPYSITSVRKQLGAHLYTARAPYYIYDAGALPRRKVSTIVRVRGKKIEMIRQGSVTIC